MWQFQKTTALRDPSMEGNITFALQKIYEAYKYLLWKAAEKENISPLQLQILRLLQQREKCRLSDLAIALQVSKPTISDALKVLSSKGMLLKIRDVNDSRNAGLSLSELGILITNRLYEYGRLTTLLSRFADKDKTMLQVLLLQMIEALGADGIVSHNKM